jgi:hypothetical protein
MSAGRAMQGMGWALLGPWLLASCSLFSPPPSVTGLEAMASARPVRVALLPMDCGPGVNSPELAEVLRVMFYGSFAALSFEDVELVAVDRLLDTSRVVDPLEAGRRLGCDAVIVGTVTRYSVFYAGVYSQLSLGLTVRMLEVKTGRELLSIAHQAVSRSAGLPLDPISAATSLATTAWHLRSKTFLDTAGELCREIVAQIPPPRLSPTGGGSELRLAAAERAAREAPDDATAQLALAKLYLAAGRYQDAEARFGRIHELRPDSELVRQMLSQVRALAAQADAGIVQPDEPARGSSRDDTVNDGGEARRPPEPDALTLR